MVCVVLAAGTARRFGRDKLQLPLPGGTLLERALKACSDFTTIAVCSPESAPHARPFADSVIVNDAPQRGMSFSLRLANEGIEPFVPIMVMPADLPLIRREHVERIVSLHGDADVTFPLHPDGTPGHPVIFSAHARAKIASLPDGDTIRTLRDDPQLRRNPILTPETWPFLDVDDESDLADL